MVQRPAAGGETSGHDMSSSSHASVRAITSCRSAGFELDHSSAAAAARARLPHH